MAPRDLCRGRLAVRPARTSRNRLIERIPLVLALNEPLNLVDDRAAGVAVGHDHRAIALHAMRERLHWKPQLLPPCWKYQPSPCFDTSKPTAYGFKRSTTKRMAVGRRMRPK